MKILFVCTGNTCRSPMAEGMFNYIAKEKGLNTVAESAGVCAGGGGATANAVDVMAELDMDISGHRARQVSGEMLDEADIIIAMTQSHKMMLASMFPGCEEKTHTMSEYTADGTDVTDPFGGILELYRICCGQIQQAVEKIIERQIKE